MCTYVGMYLKYIAHGDHMGAENQTQVHKSSAYS